MNSCHFLCHYCTNQRDALSYSLFILAKNKTIRKWLALSVSNLNLVMAKLDLSFQDGLGNCTAVDIFSHNLFVHSKKR